VIGKVRSDSEGGERQTSLALAGLVPTLGERERGHGRGRFSVLDLGPASRDNLEFFGRNGVRLTVADLYRGFGRERRSSELISKLLRYDRSDHFDLMLAWDVLNYLTREELGALVASLGPHFRSGTLIHAFIVTAREMAPAPISYRIADGRTLIRQSTEGRPIRSPRYVEPDLLRSMPGLTVEHCFQLRNGMAEYLFNFRSRQRREIALSPSPSASSSASIAPAPRSPWERGIEWTPAPSR
jgi:hypothetical protein